MVSPLVSSPCVAETGQRTNRKVSIAAMKKTNMMTNTLRAEPCPQAPLIMLTIGLPEYTNAASEICALMSYRRMLPSVKAIACFRKSTRSCLVALFSSAAVAVISDIAPSICCRSRRVDDAELCRHRTHVIDLHRPLKSLERHLAQLVDLRNR